jgi:hypothetical protein
MKRRSPPEHQKEETVRFSTARVAWGVVVAVGSALRTSTAGPGETCQRGLTAAVIGRGWCCAIAGVCGRLPVDSASTTPPRSRPRRRLWVSETPGCVRAQLQMVRQWAVTPCWTDLECLAEHGPPALPPFRHLAQITSFICTSPFTKVAGLRASTHLSSSPRRWNVGNHQSASLLLMPSSATRLHLFPFLVLSFVSSLQHWSASEGVLPSGAYVTASQVICLLFARIRLCCTSYHPPTLATAPRHGCPRASMGRARKTVLVV